MDPKDRFTSRAANYSRYRQSYPKETMDLIASEFDLGPRTIVADIGSGTGIFARSLADKVSIVYGVEPNDEMRSVAESTLSDLPSFRSVKGSAESTTLPDRSVDLITSAQSFHWFDREKAKNEFRRILKPGGKILIVWYTRTMDSDLAMEFDGLLKEYGKDYEKIDHRNVTMDVLKTFFEGPMQKRRFPSVQRLDLEMFMGRLGSVSYLPLPGEENYNNFMSKMEEFFDRYNKDGILEFDYVTDLYWGSL